MVSTCPVQSHPALFPVAAVVLLSCTVPVAFIIEEDVKEMTLLLWFMSAEAQQEPDPSLLIGSGRGSSQRRTMQYSRPV